MLPTILPKPYQQGPSFLDFLFQLHAVGNAKENGGQFLRKRLWQAWQLGPAHPKTVPIS